MCNSMSAYEIISMQMSYLSTGDAQGSVDWTASWEAPRHLGRKQLRPLLREAGFLGDPVSV